MVVNPRSSECLIWAFGRQKFYLITAQKSLFREKLHFHRRVPPDMHVENRHPFRTFGGSRRTGAQKDL